MKKIILLLLLVSGFVNAQKIGKTEIKVEGLLSNIENGDYYDKWLETSKSYMMEFKVNTIGVKNAIEMVRQILLENDVPFEKTESNKSFLASYVKNIDDYESLDTSISAGGSEVKMTWFFEGKLLYLSLKEGMYVLIVNKD